MHLGIGGTVGIEFDVLGEVRARVDDEPVDLGAARQRQVLAVLLVELNHSVSVDQLIDRVWGEHPPPSAAGTLRSYLSRLKSTLAPIRGADLERGSHGYLVRADASSVDLHRFTHLVARARATAQDDQASTLYEQAFALWHSDPFRGMDSSWFDAIRRSAEAAHYEARLDHHDVQLRRGLHSRVLADLTTLASGHPLDERLAGQLLLALYRSGRQAEALEHYERVRVRLAEELGTDLSAPLRRLHQQILDADVSLSSRPARRDPVPRQLPAPPRVFSGRTRELAVLDTKGLVVISAISGIGGIGKTWLALHWAHQHLDSFPDGQLYANMRGFDPSAQPVPPDVVLRSFLVALRADPATIPSDLDARAAQFRGLAAGKRMLIVLDNVRDTEQVVPLLPGDTASTVLVTSRRSLTGLVLAHSARSVGLDVLGAEDALDLVTRHLGAHRVGEEAASVAELLDYCGGLPLALGIVAARALVRPDLPLAQLAAELHDRAGRLDGLDTGDTGLNLRAVLSWSYDALSAESAALFGLLGLVPGPDIGLNAVASLAALRPSVARARLRELETAHLVSQPVPGRYRMHDLVRLYAAELAQKADDRVQALRRMVDHHVHTAFRGEQVQYPQRKPIDLDPIAEGVRPEEPADVAAALAWFEAEHANLLAVQRLAADIGRHGAVWHLAWSLTTYHNRTANITDWLVVWQAALRSTELLDDQRALLFVHRYLADGHARQGRHDLAMEHLDVALATADRLGDHTVMGHVHYGLASAWEQQEDIDRALEHAREALRHYREVGVPTHLAQGNAGVGWFEARLGHYDRARTHSEEALALYRETGNRDGEAGTLDTLGYIAQHNGELEVAVERYRETIALFREVGNRSFQAEIMVRLGQAHTDLGRPDLCREVWTEALAILREQDREAEALKLEDRLAALGAA
ncbi:MAG TPA: BTAD domain-containing putative transcriptional regulator [Umezawaea sp.]|nr:BTAD domain-containing putative transcriptional regulator [Umezawaea sp.]